jgi:hypothetical protein
MKKLIIALSLVAILGGLGLYGGKVVEFFQNETIVINNKPETIIKTERVDNLEVLIKEAQDAAKGQIEAKAKATRDSEESAAKAAYEAALAAAEVKHDKYIVDEMVKVSDKVKEDYIAEIEATISSTEY